MYFVTVLNVTTYNCALVGVNRDGRLEVFGVGGDHALWHIAQTSPGDDWGGWSSLGGQVVSDPTVRTVSVNNDGRKEAFVRGSDNALWHIPQVSAGGRWGAWSSLGGVLANGPPPMLVYPGIMTAFVEGYYDASLWYIKQISSGFWN